MPKKESEKKALILTQNEAEARTMHGKLMAEKIHLSILPEGLKGISEIEKGKFKLVIIDSSLKDIIALEVCSLIRYKFTSKQLPILIIFKEEEKEYFENSQKNDPIFEEEFDTYFRPLEFEILVKHIKQLI